MKPSDFYQNPNEGSLGNEGFANMIQNKSWALSCLN